MNMWNKIKEKIFPPPEVRWLVWMLVPSVFFVFSGIILILEKSFFQATLLAFAVTIQMVYTLTGKKSFFIFGLMCFVSLSAYTYVMQGDIIWALSLFISLCLAYEITGQVRAIFQIKESVNKELERDVDLWRNRFETSLEKIDSTSKVFEIEIEKLEKVIEMKKNEIESLRVLISISHKETRRAEKRMDGLTQALGSQQEALKARQLINESLQTKKSVKQPISLKDLR